jgi:hypothetical protein
MRKMFAGREILKKLVAEMPSGSTYKYNNMLIKGASAERGIELYQTGINKFLGNSLIKRLEKTEFGSNEDLRKRLTPELNQGKGEWIDLAGLITPKSEVDKLLNVIESGKICSVEQLSESFINMHKSYYDWEWTWACEKIEDEAGKPVSEMTSTDIIGIVERWKNSVVELDELLYEDARKEFTLSSMTGFGIDGGDEVKKLDFEQVRGEFESNSVVTAIQEHIKQKSALGNELLERMKRISYQIHLSAGIHFIIILSVIAG